MSEENDNGDGSDFDEKTNIFKSTTAKIDISKYTSAPPCLVVTAGPKSIIGKQWNLTNPQSFLGRLQSSDVHLVEISVSKKHALMEKQDGKYWIVDLGSTNGTVINGKRINPNVKIELKNNDQFSAGEVVFKFLERGVLTETSEKARMQNELEVVRNVQTSFLPSKSQATYEWVKIIGYYRSATESGGDWWWHWTPGNKAFVIIGDVTGHGAGAAMITSAARSAISTIEDDETITIEKVYSTLTSALYKTSSGQMSMSAFIIEIDYFLKIVRFINASHLPAILLDKKVDPKLWNKLPHLNDPRSPPLGSGSMVYGVGETSVQPGQRLILITDGITERKNELGVELNEREFYKALIQCHNSYPSKQDDFIRYFVQESDINAGNAELADDMTVVAIDFAF